MFRNPTDDKKLTKKLNYQFKNKNLLLQALTRSSALNEGLQACDIGDFQRLEFIGDKVLNLIISDIVMEQHPKWKEGNLTQEVAKFVNNKGPLASVALSLNLDEFLIMGSGEEMHNQARKNEKVLSDAMEALIGAIWLDSKHNYPLLKQLIALHWAPLGLGKLATTPELNDILYDIDDKIEQDNAVKEWLARPMTLDTLRSAANLLLSWGNFDYLKHILDSQRLTQTDLNELLLAAFDFYEEEWGNGAQEKPAAIALLLQYGANANTVCGKHSLLYAAIEYQCDSETIALLLKHQADVNWHSGKLTQETNILAHNPYIVFPCKDVKDFTTPLHKILSTPYPSEEEVTLVSLLLNHQANPNLQNHEGKTPLHLACEALYPDDFHVMSYLGDDEYNPVPTVTIIHHLLEAKTDVKLQDKEGNTPLHLLLQKWLRLQEKAIGSIDTPLFLQLTKKMLVTENLSALKNKAGETAYQLAKLIRLSGEALKFMGKNLAFSSSKQYSLAEVIVKPERLASTPENPQYYFN